MLTPSRYTIEQEGNRFAIVKDGDEIIADYSRRSDAIRGADRRGIILGNL